MVNAEETHARGGPHVLLIVVDKDRAIGSEMVSFDERLEDARFRLSHLEIVRVMDGLEMVGKRARGVWIVAREVREEASNVDYVCVGEQECSLFLAEL